MTRLDELTGLRCVAVCLVLFNHSTSFLPDWIAKFGAFGDTGVQIFFVLSGFLITTLLDREYVRTGGIDFWSFYRRRLLRISPAFYVFLSIVGLFALLGWINASWQQLAISGTYLWNYARLLGIDSSYATHPDGEWYLGHTWTLALEEQFYWIWPAIFLVTRRRNVEWALPAVILIVPGIRIGTYFLEPSVRGQTHMMFHTAIDTIMMGAFVAVHRQRLSRQFRRQLNNGTLLTAAVIALLLVVPKVELSLGGLWTATYGATLEAAIIGFLLLAIIVQPRHWFSKLLRMRPFVLVGLISYSLYLWQQFFTFEKSPAFPGFPLNIAAAIATACLSYVLVERPFLVLKDRLESEPAPRFRDRSTA